MAQSQRRIDGGRIPGPASIPGVVEIVCVYQLGANKYAKNYFAGSYSGSPPPLQAAADALFTSLGAAFSNNLGSHMATTTQLVRVEVRDMASYTNPVYIGTGASIPGTGTGSSMPLEMAVVMTEDVDVRGRGAKGRAYLTGWVAAAGTAGGMIDPAVVSAVNTYGQAVVNAINAQGLLTCVPKPARQLYTGLTGTNHPARGATKALVTRMECRNNAWDNQRRRGYK